MSWQKEVVLVEINNATNSQKRKVRITFIALALIIIFAAGYLMGNTNGNTDKANSSGNDIDVEDVLKLKHTLRFREDGSFKILMFGDIQDKMPVNKKTLAAMNLLLDEEQPDLVILMGDNHDGNFTSLKALSEYLDIITEPMESRKIPWSHIYGNHDEGSYGFSNGLPEAEQQKLYEKYDYCISKAGPEDVYGVGNYVLPILRSDSDKIAFNVWALDSNSYLNKFEPGIENEFILPKPLANGKVYDPIHFDQIKWYWDTSVALEQYNGSPIPAMMCFHIPLYEFNYITNNPRATQMDGTKGEDICAPEVNSGLLFATYLRKDVKGIFCAHDHLNDFSGTYAGITLAYTSTIGFNEYGDDNRRGARIVEINQDDAANYTTRMAYLKDYGFFDGR